MSSQVLLVNPNQMKPVVGPVALDYLADALAARGFGVKILDLCFSSNVAADIESAFQGERYTAVGITIRNTDDCYYASQDSFLPRIKAIVDQIKAHTDSPIVLGGCGFSLMPESVLRFCEVDWGFVGDGEEVLPELVDRLGQGTSAVQDLPGLIYRSDGGFRAHPPAFPDFDALPAATRSALDNRRYFIEGGMAGIETKRGCPQGCIYCADSVAKGRKCRVRSPEKVADEIQALLDQGIDYYHLCDSEFNIPERHARGVCQEIIGRGLGSNIHWYTYASPAPFSPNLAALMREAGCVGIDFGVDSGDDSILRALGRDFAADQLRKTAQICHEQGIIFMYDLLLGGPGETKDTVANTIQLMKEIKPSRVGASYGVRIYPGTELGKMVEQEGVTSQNPHLQGQVEGNGDFSAPIFYLSADLGPDAEGYLSGLIGDDPRFFLPSSQEVDQNYNYNDNTVLVNAIREGYRGAFWDILRRLQEGEP